MTTPDNPFRRPAAPAATPRSSGLAWGLVVLALLFAAAVFLFHLRNRQRQRSELAALQARLNEADASLERARAINQNNLGLIATLQAQKADLEKEKELAGQMARNLESELRSDLESKDVTISQLQGRLTVTIIDRVMFDSGEANLKPAGAAVMQKIAAILTAHPQLKIHVVGHTDNVPIRPSAQTRFASNWELSAARALAAVHYLTERAGIAPLRVGAVGYGEFRPVADNATPEGRAQNRRIEISILPAEAAAAAATSTTPPLTPSPPEPSRPVPSPAND